MDAATSVVASANRGDINWPGGPSKKQNWSLPESIIYYMAKNPSSAKCYQKLAQSCKYFFEKNPILVATRICHERLICSKSNDFCFNNGGRCCITIDYNKISSKIWLTAVLSLHEKRLPNFVTFLRPKLYRCENECLTFSNKVVKFDDFKFLASAATNFCFDNVKIIDYDGSIVSLEKLFEYIPNVKEFLQKKPSTFKNAAEFKKLEHLQNLVLFNIPEIFDVDALSTFISTHKDSKFTLSFNRKISAGYKTKLNGLIDTIIESNVPNRLIFYGGQDIYKLRILRKRFTAR